MVCAHRGASSSFPENTIPAFAEAVSLGCGMIEFEFHIPGDNVIIVENLVQSVDRTTTDIRRLQLRQPKF